MNQSFFHLQPIRAATILIGILLYHFTYSCHSFTIVTGVRTKSTNQLSHQLHPSLADKIIQPITTPTTTTTAITTTTRLKAAPKEALSDIVIPGVFEFSKDVITQNEDPRVWVPQTDCLSFRPLCLCVSQGYYVNLLRFKGGGVLGKHRHSSPVHAMTLKGSWGYKEHEWNAKPGTYVFEPPGETHTLLVDEDCEEMIAMFHVTGSLLYVDEEGDDVIGFDDVFSKLEKAKKWYKECGLGEDYVQQFVR